MKSHNFENKILNFNDFLGIFQTVVALLALVAVASAGVVSPVAYGYAPASYLTRSPAHDSAVIKSDRLGGNFAYSVAESHAYAQPTPIVQQVTSPVAVSYSAPAVQYASAPAVQYAAAPAAVQYAAAPSVQYSAAPAVQYAATQYAGVPAVQYAATQYAGVPAIGYGYNNAAYGYGYAAAPGLGYTTLLKK